MVHKTTSGRLSKGSKIDSVHKPLKVSTHPPQQPFPFLALRSRTRPTGTENWDLCTVWTSADTASSTTLHLTIWAINSDSDLPPTVLTDPILALNESISSLTGCVVSYMRPNRMGYSCK